MEEYCKTTRERILHNRDLSRCNGIVFVPPHKITDKQLEHWYQSMSKMNRALDDLICAWENYKIAMIDNDTWPTHPLNNHSANEPVVDETAYFIRYVVTHKCNHMKILITDEDDDPTTIYYHRDKWMDALILYLFHNRRLKFPNTLPYDIHIFQGILLGYSRDSIMLYYFEPPYFEENILDQWATFDSTEKHAHYRIYYDILFSPENKKEFMEIYDPIHAWIESYKQILQADPIMKAFAYGLEDVASLRKGGRRKSRVRRRKTLKKK